MRHLFISVLLLFAAGTSFAAEQVSPERRLVEDALNAYGGVKALEAVKSVYAKGQITAFMQADEGTSIRYFQRPRKLRAELVYGKSSETRIINGSKGWRRSNNKSLAEVIGPPFLGMAYQYKYLDLPFGFLDNGYSIKVLTKDSINGHDVDVLLLEDAEGPPIKVFLDAKTHLIAKVSGAFSFGSIGTELKAEFSDYRTVDGVKFPFRIINYGGENKIAETVINELRVNQEMRDELFLP